MALQSAQIQPNAAKPIGWNFSVQMDSVLKHPVKTAQQLLKADQWNVLQWPSQSADLNPSENKSEGRKTHKQPQLKEAAVKAWPSISREETQL